MASKGIMRLLLLPLLILGVSASSTGATASSVRPARLEGMEYGEARQFVVSLGWVPVASNCDGIDAETCSRFPEIGNCSGTGMGYCDMHFARKDRCLDVVTTGGYPAPMEQGTTVSDVYFRRAPCSMKNPDRTTWP